MAIDTSRERLEKVFQTARDQRLWGPTWAEFVAREPNRVIVQSRKRGRGFLNVLVAIAAIGLFGLYPAIGGFTALSGIGIPFGWNDPWTCDGLRYRYELARNTVGTPGFVKAHEDFANARVSCERYAVALPSATRGSSCQAAVRTYLRALGRVERGAAGLDPSELDAPWVVEVMRDRGRRADAVLGIDEIEREERMAAAYLDACDG